MPEVTSSRNHGAGAPLTNDQREPDLRTLAKIARVLNTSADHLLGITDPQPLTERARLLDRLNVAAASLTDEELAPSSLRPRRWPSRVQ